MAVIPQYCEDFYAVPQHDAALEQRFVGRFNLVFTGTFTPAQSLDMVLRAVLDARAAGAERLHLLLVGDGMSREALQSLAHELHAGDAVTFYGSVPAADVPKFTALADALLISLSDSPDLGLTVPGKLASYMAAGKPVLASMNGAGYTAVQESGGGTGREYAGAVRHDRCRAGGAGAQSLCVLRRTLPESRAVETVGGIYVGREMRKPTQPIFEWLCREGF